MPAHGAARFATRRRSRRCCLRLLPAAAAFADGDAARGAQVFRACAACHAVAPGANYSGPSLAGVWGRKAGTLAGFGRYSDALRRSGLAWNRTTLDLWLRDPAALVPGNAMTFAGIGDAVARADVIAYLRALSRGEAVAKPEERQPNPDLKTAPPAARIAALRYCRGSHAYFVTDGTGRVTPYWEFNLRFKSDSAGAGRRRHAGRQGPGRFRGSAGDFDLHPLWLLNRARR